MSNFVLTPNAVAKLRRAIAPRSGNTGAVAASGRPIDPDKFPPPFTVRWSASAASGAGAWIIWLPGLGNLVAFGGVFIPTIGGISAAQALPSGWYTVSDIPSNPSAIYLVVVVDDSTNAATAVLSGVPGQGTTGETVYNVKVADIATSAAGAKSVKQYVDSVVTISKNGSGGGLTGSVEFVADVDWYVNGSVHQLRKRLRVLDLATGNVTNKVGTTYANGWEVATNTTPISSIIGS